jgi:molybdopterin-guanine dinucleotide biosynthesis protein A
VLRVAAPLSVEVLLSVSQEPTPFADVLGVRTVVDSVPGRGVLGGLHTTLTASRTWHNLVVACDMPFLNAGLLRHMAGLARGYDLVVPRLEGQTEPLHAIYSKGCIGPITRLLEQGHRRIADMFPLVRVCYVEQEEVERYDLHRLSFFNVNTEADLERAREIEGGTALDAPRPPRSQA